MPVRSKRLFGPTTVGAGAAVLYTCPAGETAILKDLRIGPGALGGITTTLYIGAAVAANRVLVVSQNAGDWFVGTGEFLVLQPGEVLRATSGAAGVQITGCGAELEGVAD